jgi:hypothetical protein
MFKMMKVFECMDMPDNIRKILFKLTEHIGGNDCYVMYTIHNEDFSQLDMNKPDNIKWVSDKNALDNWFIENGANSAKDENSEGEDIIVSRWW